MNTNNAVIYVLRNRNGKAIRVYTDKERAYRKPNRCNGWSVTVENAFVLVSDKENK